MNRNLVELKYLLMKRKVIRLREKSHWHQTLDMNFDREIMPQWLGPADPKDKAGHFKIDYVRVWQKK